MSFSDYPFSPKAMGPQYTIDPRSYPRQEEVLRYIHAFVERYGLDKVIKYGTTVVRVTPVTPAAAAAARPAHGGAPGTELWGQQWVVETEPAGGKKGGATRETFDAVMVRGERV